MVWTLIIIVGVVVGVGLILFGLFGGEQSS